jgi:hypothetical protein
VWAWRGTRPQGWSNKQEREGGETRVIDDDKGEADKMMMAGVVVIGRVPLAVASTREIAV